MAEKNKLSIDQNRNSIQSKRIEYLIEMIAIKKDTNMTRIYSAFTKTDFSSQSDNQTKTSGNDNYI